MKTFNLIVCSVLLSFSLKAQSIVGKWQLVKQSNCVEEEIVSHDSEEDALVSDMKSMGGPSGQVIQFKENQSGEETTRVLSKKKAYNPKSFLYKFNGEALYILDKKSRTILEGYTVEKMDGDSLIISNAARACETKVFVKIK